MSFTNRFNRSNFVFVFVLLSFIAISASQTFSQNIIISVDSISGQLGDKRIPLDIHLTMTQDTLAAFEIWFQLSSPDIINFASDSSTSNVGSVIESWSVGSRSLIGTYTDLDVNGVYPIPNTNEFLFPLVNNELFFKCYVDVADSFIILPTDSIVSIVVETNFIENFSFSDPNGNTIGITYQLHEDTLCYQCTQWEGDNCLSWQQIPNLGDCDSTAIVFDSSAILDTSYVQVNYGTFTLLPTCGYNAGAFDISNLVSLVDFMFASGPELSIEDADCNCDCLIDVADLVCFVDYMFGGGADPGCGN